MSKKHTKALKVNKSCFIIQQRHRIYMPEILPIRRKTPYNQSINSTQTRNISTFLTIYSGIDFETL